MGDLSRSYELQGVLGSFFEVPTDMLPWRFLDDLLSKNYTSDIVVIANLTFWFYKHKFHLIHMSLPKAERNGSSPRGGIDAAGSSRRGSQ